MVENSKDFCRLSDRTEYTYADLAVVSCMEGKFSLPGGFGKKSRESPTADSRQRQPAQNAVPAGRQVMRGSVELTVIRKKITKRR